MSNISDFLKNNLNDTFNPEHLEVINESHLHAGHAGDNGTGESHFRIKIIAQAFNDMSRLERHRAVNAVAKPKLDEGLHALAIEANGTSNS